MKVMCARGEYEPASFLVETDEPLEQVMVTVSPLRGWAGRLPAEAVDVRIAQKFAMAVTWTREVFPWVIVHDPGMMQVVDHMPRYFRELKEEDWGSPGVATFQEYKEGHGKINRLFKERIDTDALQAADVAGRRQFWLTVHVPEDAKSGTYYGKVKITAANARTRTLALEVTVPSFDLLPPEFEYSVYYPSYLDRSKMSDAQRERMRPITEQQDLAEGRNMVAHGCNNPCIYAGPEQDAEGNIYFTHLSRLLDLREKAGMPRGVTL